MRKKILVCDDDDGLRQALRMLLERDYDVVEASGGAEAVRIVAADPPNLVLLDVSMPGMTGLQTLRAYSQDRPELRTIVLSTRRQLGIARRALGLGAVAYVTKPFDPDYLAFEIARLLAPARVAEKSGRPWRVALEAGSRENL